MDQQPVGCMEAAQAPEEESKQPKVGRRDGQDIVTEV